jgi:metal-dependent amidase/aminoacylase/carboxypeptidase family protein
MLKIFALIVLGLMVSASCASAQLTAAPGYVIVDGEKNPQKIPEWSVLDYTFRTLTQGQFGALPTEIEEVATPQEKALIARVAVANEQRRVDMEQKVAELSAKLLNPEDIKNPELTPNERTFLALTTEDVEKYQERVVRAWKRLLERLSPDTKQVMLTYMEKRSAATHMQIPK